MGAKKKGCTDLSTHTVKTSKEGQRIAAAYITTYNDDGDGGNNGGGNDGRSTLADTYDRLCAARTPPS